MAMDFPKGHWIHAAAAKEKARMEKQKKAIRPTGKMAVKGQPTESKPAMGVDGSDNAVKMGSPAGDTMC